MQLHRGICTFGALFNIENFPIYDTTNIESPHHLQVNDYEVISSVMTYHQNLNDGKNKNQKINKTSPVLNL